MVPQEPHPSQMSNMVLPCTSALEAPGCCCEEEEDEVVGCAPATAEEDAAEGPEAEAGREAEGAATTSGFLD